MLAPAISILVPVWNAASTLPAMLRSIRVQTYTDYECVLVDDGSSDATPSLLRAAARRDDRVRVVSRGHSGIVQALNAGLEHCRGRYVARMDADDRMHRERLARQLAAMERDPGLTAVGSHVRLFPRARLTEGRLAYESWVNSLATEDDVLRDRFVECPLVHPTLFIRRDALDEYAYRDASWAEDYDLILRMLARGLRLSVVPLPLLAWRDGSARLSRTHRAYTLERFTACKAAFLANTWLDADTYVLWGYGDTGRTLCKALATQGRHPSHIVELHPGRVGQTVAGAPVISPEALERLSPRPRHVVVSVAGQTARSLIRASLDKAGFVERRDYLCLA